MVCRHKGTFSKSCQNLSELTGHMIDFGNVITKRPFLLQTEGEWKLGMYAEEINLFKHLGYKKISHLKSMEPLFSCSFISMSGSFGPAVRGPVRVCLLNHYRPRWQEQVWQHAGTFAQHHRNRKTTSPLGISTMFATGLQSKLPFGKKPAESRLDTRTRETQVISISFAKTAFIQRLVKLNLGSETRSNTVWVWRTGSKRHFTSVCKSKR